MHYLRPWLSPELKRFQDIQRSKSYKSMQHYLNDGSNGIAKQLGKLRHISAVTGFFVKWLVGFGNRICLSIINDAANSPAFLYR